MAIQQQEIADLLQKLDTKAINFSDVITFIEQHYTHTPTAFQNGQQANAATENQGSAKLLYFAQLHQLPEMDTLKLFAEHYDDVLSGPEATTHQNIRQFQKYGWSGVFFDGQALYEK